MNNETEFGVEERERATEEFARLYGHSYRPTKDELRLQMALTRAEAQRDDALNELGFQLRSRVNAIGRAVASRRRGEYVTSLQAEVDKQQKRAEAVEAQLAAVRGELATVLARESATTARYDERLEKAEAALRERGGDWTSVLDRMPEPGEQVECLATAEVWAYSTGREWSYPAIKAWRAIQSERGKGE